MGGPRLTGSPCPRPATGNATRTRIRMERWIAQDNTFIPRLNRVQVLLFLSPEMRTIDSLVLAIKCLNNAQEAHARRNKN